MARESEFVFPNTMDLTKDFVKLLVELGYEELNIGSEEELLKNLRTQLEILNKDIGLKFSDLEWEDFFFNSICKRYENYVDKLKKIQHKGWKQPLIKENGERLEVMLIDKWNIHNNKLQFLEKHSLENEQEKRVTILFNGLPLIHVELHNPCGDIKEIFQNISNEWKEKSFGASYNFFDYIQIFVLSTVEETKYYSCTTRNNFISNIEKGFFEDYEASNSSFLFTSYWSARDGSKNYIALEEFTRHFFDQRNVREMIINYSVLTNVDSTNSRESKPNLRVMRPYQIFAVKSILEKINSYPPNRLADKRDAGGYIWHATGSGKTLTSFKAARLASQIDEIYKVIFVVDRKDLDIQTQREYEIYEQGASQGIKDTQELLQMLRSPDRSKIIITTIQKLNNIFSKRDIYLNPVDNEIFKKRMVLIFDECHRTQTISPTGNKKSMHSKIRAYFPNSHIFGFTGTPIFSEIKESENEEKEQQAENLDSTESLFGKQLHKYTLCDAMNDQNVLNLLIEYYGWTEEEGVCGIFLPEKERVEKITQNILENYDCKTQRPDTCISIQEKRTKGFNAMLAVESINMAKQYYREFKKQLEKETVNSKKLTVMTIYSAQDSKNSDNLEESNSENLDVQNMPISDQEFLEKVVMEDYHKIFGVKYTIRQFSTFRENIMQKVRKKEIDLLIVVNMFLTGFDAPCLNTLWVDKKLQKHGLIQAFSRTNRISIPVKETGNIICFQNDQKVVEESLQKYAGGRDVDLKKYKSKKDLQEDYLRCLNNLRAFSVNINCFKVTKETANEYMISFEDFFKNYERISLIDPLFLENEGLVSEEFLDNAKAAYSEAEELIEERGEGPGPDDKGPVPRPYPRSALSLLGRTEITYDYLLWLVLQEAPYFGDDSQWKEKIYRKIKSAPSLRKLAPVFEKLLESGQPITTEGINKCINDEKEKEKEINEIIQEENLSLVATNNFINKSLKFNEFDVEKADMTELLIDHNWENGQETFEKITRVEKKLKNVWIKFRGVWKPDIVNETNS